MSICDYTPAQEITEDQRKQIEAAVREEIARARAAAIVEAKAQRVYVGIAEAFASASDALLRASKKASR